MDSKSINDAIGDDLMLCHIYEKYKAEQKIELLETHALIYINCEKFRNIVNYMKNILKTEIILKVKDFNKNKIDILCDADVLITYLHLKCNKFLNYLPHGIKRIYIEHVPLNVGKIMSKQNRKIKLNYDRYGMEINRRISISMFRKNVC